MESLVSLNENDLYYLWLIEQKVPYWKKWIMWNARMFKKNAARKLLNIKWSLWQLRKIFYKTEEEKMALHICEWRCIRRYGESCPQRTINFIRIKKDYNLTNKERALEMRRLQTMSTPNGLIGIPALLAEHMFMRPEFYRYCISELVGREISSQEIFYQWDDLVKQASAH